MDSVRDSGSVKFHGVDDGSQESVHHWSLLRHLPPGLLQQPPHSLVVRLNSPRQPRTEAVKIISLGERKGDLPPAIIINIVEGLTYLSRIPPGGTDRSRQ